MEVDILEFKVPVENNKTVFVWDIQPSHTEAQIYVSPPGAQVWVSTLCSFYMLDFRQTVTDVCVVPQDALYSVFSSFGPLYLLKVCPNAPISPPGFYALVKFYSAAQASKAQRQTDGRPLFQSSPLKVVAR